MFENNENEFLDKIWKEYISNNYDLTNDEFFDFNEQFFTLEELYELLEDKNLSNEKYDFIENLLSTKEIEDCL